MTFDSENDKATILNLLQNASIQGKDAEYVVGLMQRIKSAKVEDNGAE